MATSPLSIGGYTNPGGSIYPGYYDPPATTSTITGGFGNTVTTPTGQNPSMSTIGQDLGVAGPLSALDQLLNQLNVGGQAASNKQALSDQTAANNAQPLPQQAALQKQSSADISSALSGQLPPDVLNLIQQQGAERGVATGSPGSPNANASMLQALGLTSLGLEQTGQSELNSAISSNRVANPVASVGTAPVSNPLSLLQLPNANAGAVSGSSSTSAPLSSNPAVTSGLNAASALGTSANPATGTAATNPAPAGIDQSVWDSLFGTDSATGNAGSTTLNPADTAPAFASTGGYDESMGEYSD